MDIELKSIKHSPSLSRETEAFTATLYINGVHAGFAENQGHGGNTNYYPKDEKGRELISEAETYCKGLDPRPSLFDPGKTYEITLEDVIDDFLSRHLTKRELLRVAKKMEKHSAFGVVFGKPGESSYSSLTYKVPLTTLLATARGEESLKNTIKEIVPELINGKIILNTNIPERILKDAGLKELQYLKPIAQQEKQKHQIKKTSRKL